MPRSYVLVVDPNPSIRRRVEEAFAETDYGVLWAKEAEEALELATGQDVAVVLAATSLPRGNGYDLSRTLIERHPAAAVFLLSGGFEVYSPQRAEEAGVVGRLGKPFTAARLQELVGGVVGPFPRAAREDGDPVTEELPELPAASFEAMEGSLPVVPLPARQPAPSGFERVATFLPRDYQQLPVVAVDPGVVGPAIERAIMEVLPEVVEAVLRAQLAGSPGFREALGRAVQEAVSVQLPEALRHLQLEREPRSD